jgi:hypothetical protein
VFFLVVIYMRIKKYSRRVAVNNIKNSVDLDVLNSRLQVFFVSCKMQLSVFNSVLSQDNNTSEYKNLVKEYSESKKKYKKISRSK